MSDVSANLGQLLMTEFDGKTVGSGGDYGSTLTRGPFTIDCSFEQKHQIVYPVIKLEDKGRQYIGAPVTCCGGGPSVHQYLIKVSVDSNKHSRTIAWILAEAISEYLCGLSESDDLDDDVSVIVEPPSLIPIEYEYPIFSVAIQLRLYYVKAMEI